MRAVSRLLGLTSVVVFSCGAPEAMPDGGATSTARVRVVHLSPDAPAIDAYVNDEAAAVKQLAFASGSDVKKVPAGRGAFRVTAAASASAVATASDVLFEQDRDYTAFAFGKLANLQLNVVENDTRGLASGSVRLRVIHAADGVGAVNVFQVPATGAPVSVAPNLRYGAPAAPVDVPDQPFVVGLDVDADQSPDLLFDVPALPRGAVVNVFAVLDASGAPFLLAQLQGSTTPRLTPLFAQLRVLHLSPGAPAVEAFVDGAKPEGYQRISFTQSTPYASLSAGAHRLEVSADGTAAGAVLTVPSAQFAAGKRYTAVAYDAVASLKALLIEDAEAPTGASIKVRAIHAAPGVGQVDVLSLAADGTTSPVVSDVSFGQVSAALELPAGAYTLGVDVNDDANADLYFELPNLPGGTTANVFVTQDAQGSVFALAQLGDGTIARVEPSTSKLRVVHLSRNAPAVDVYANGAKVVTNLAYAVTTTALEVSSGAYALAVTATGAPIGSAVLNVPGVKLLPGRSYTALAYGDLASITAALLEDDASGLNTNTDIRLRITHAATTVTRGDVYAVKPTGNTLLVPNIGFGETKGALDLASSSYTVGFDAESNGTIDIAFDLPVLAPGSFANVFVATDAVGQVYLLIQTTGAGALRVNPR